MQEAKIFCGTQQSKQDIYKGCSTKGETGQSLANRKPSRWTNVA
jgi:hypothetical protein